MEIPKNPDQTPFKENDLLTKGNFEKFCRDQGVLVFIKDLNYLYEEKILIPVLRIYRGYGVYKKIYAHFDGKKEWRFVDPENVKEKNPEKVEPESYYHTTGIFYRKGWLIENYKAGFLSFPSQEKTICFDSYTPGFVSDVKKIENDSELFYNRNQFIVLKLIFQDVKFLKKASEKWKKVFLEGSKKTVQNFNKLLHLYEDVGVLLEAKRKDSENAYKKFYKENEKHKANAEKETKAYEKHQQKEKFSLKANKLLKKHKLNADNLQDWIWKIAQKSFLREGSFHCKFVEYYIKNIPDKILKEEYVNEFLSRLVEFQNLVELKSLSLQDVLFMSSNFSHCPICHATIPAGEKHCQRAKCKKSYPSWYKSFMRKWNPDYGQ